MAHKPIARYGLDKPLRPSVMAIRNPMMLEHSLSSALQHGAIAKGTPAFRRMSLAMLAAGFSTFSVLYGVQPLLPMFADTFRLTPAESSLAISAATAPLACTIVIAGLVSDRLGRRPLMMTSLFSAALLTFLVVLLPGWTTLLGLRFLTGVALAGIPSVAIAYIADEVEPASVGASIGLYIAGSAFGGMTARLGVSVMAQYLGWRPSFAVLGVTALLSAVAFWRLSPVPRGFVATDHDARAILASASRLFADRALLLLFAVGAVVMGAFVTLYNYTGFRLLAPPYSMSHTAVGAIFLLYILGSASSTLFGSVSGRFSRRHVFWMPAVLLLLGIMLTAAHPLALIVGGIAIATIGIFGIHSIAASWVSHRAGADRSLASALYLFCYYMGASLLGPVGGLAWGAMQWPGVVLFTGTLGLLVLIAALLLIRIPPLPQNLHRPEDEPQLPPG